MFIALFLTRAPRITARMSSTDWSGTGATLGLIVMIAAIIVAAEFGQGLPMWMMLLGVPAIGAVSGLVFTRFCTRVSVQLQAHRMIEAAAVRERETARKIAEAKASGAFDRWSHRAA